MNRFFGGLLLAVIVFFGSTSSVGAVDTLNFRITNFDISYQLGRDSDGRSTLKTTEKITAVFPDFDQNHGLERAIPNSYDGHPTSLKIESVTDANNNTLNYSMNSDSSVALLRIGDADKYVHGEQTYVITYSQRDVTRFFANTGSDEFYWDTNGTAWRVPIDKLQVRLETARDLQGQMTGKSACYQGQYGQSGLCSLQSEGGSYTVSAENLVGGENISVAIGFRQGTFAVYEMSLFEKIMTIWGAWQAASVALMGVVGAFFARAYRKFTRGGKLGTIVPEYLPPKDMSVSGASQVIGGSAAGRYFAAQIIDLAVRHYVVIRETREQKWLRPAGFELEIVRDISGLRPEEQRFLKSLFSGNATVGTRLDMDSLKNNNSVYTAIQSGNAKIKPMLEKQGYWQEYQVDQGRLKKGATILSVIGVVLLSIPLTLLGVVLLVMARSMKSATPKFIEMRRYLEGLKMYIGVAEVERLKMLQSPEGAAKTGGAGQDTGKLIKLYERVLPYAMLFGQAKEWNDVLGQYYSQINQQPDWYIGQGVFNGAALSGAMNSMATSLSSYSSSSSSSSSGGSFGGGFSGGGGGGGGGGGW